MAKIERVRETWSRPITAEYLAQQASFGWKLVSVIWEREIEPDPGEPSPRQEDPPYGLRVAADGVHLEENTAELEVLLVRDAIPLAFPVPDGSKFTAKMTYWPGPRVTPCPIPLVVKPAPETEFCCKVSELPPVLEKVTPCVVPAPTATSPKSTLELYMVKTAAGAGLDVPPPLPLPLPQPDAVSTPARSADHNQLILVFIPNFLHGPVGCT